MDEVRINCLTPQELKLRTNLNTYVLLEHKQLFDLIRLHAYDPKYHVLTNKSITIDIPYDQIKDYDRKIDYAMVISMPMMDLGFNSCQVGESEDKLVITLEW